MKIIFYITIETGSIERNKLNFKETWQVWCTKLKTYLFEKSFLIILF